MTTYVLRLNRLKVYGVELYRKQYHQVIIRLAGDIGPFKYGDIVQINLNTLETELVNSFTESEAA